MDIFFADPNEVPLPRDEVRIRELTADPWPDGRRVRVYLEVDPFQARPNADLVILDSRGRQVAHANIIESIDRKIEVTLHLRGDTESGISRSNPYTVHAQLYYSDIEVDDEANASGALESTPPQAPPADPTGEPAEVDPLERQVVDQAQTSFEIPEG